MAQLLEAHAPITSPCHQIDGPMLPLRSYRPPWSSGRKEVLVDGAPVTGVARRYGVARQTVHDWLRKYAAEGLRLSAGVRSDPRDFQDGSNPICRLLLQLGCHMP